MKSVNTNNKNWPAITRIFGDKYAVWFRKSKTFLLLEQPAYRVLQLLTEGKNATAISTVCTNEFSIPDVDAGLFVNELVQIFTRLNRYKKSNRLSQKKKCEKISIPNDFNTTKHYRFGSTVVRFDFQNEWLQHIVHPSFLHHDCDCQIAVEHHIRCFGNNEFLVLSYNGKTIEAFRKTDIEYYKGAVSQLVYSILYKKPFHEWMCTLHASGVHLNNRAIIFSAAAGSGKSTVSSILHANGCQLISDDFVAATPDGRVYPFPASMTVKEGAMPVLSKLYTELKEKKPEKASTGKMVRYLPVYNYDEKLLDGIGVSAFVFVKYEAGSGFSFSAIDKKEALQLLLQETWVNPKSKFVDAFFTWVENTPFYRMTYDNNEKMIAAVKKLLTNDE